jgi:hypothetical protein
MSRKIDPPNFDFGDFKKSCFHIEQIGCQIVKVSGIPAQGKVTECFQYGFWKCFFLTQNQHEKNIAQKLL